MQLSEPLAQKFQHVRSALLLGYPAMHALPSVLHDARYVSESASEMRGLPGAAAGGLVVLVCRLAIRECSCLSHGGSWVELAAFYLRSRVSGSLISDICAQSALCWSHGDYNAWCVGRRGMRHLEGQLQRPSEIPYPKLCQTSGRFSHIRTAGGSIKPSGRTNLASYSKLAPSRSTLIGYAHWPAPGLQRIFGPSLVRSSA